MPKPLTVWIARVQPPQDPGEAKGETALVNEWMNERGIEERKRLIFLGLHRKPIKLQDKKFALSMEATCAFPVSRGSEDAERLPVQVLETRADKWMQGASMLQGISLTKRVRERKKEREKKRKTWGWPSFFGEQGPLLYFQKGLLYLNLYIEGNERCKVIQSQPKHYICFVFIKTRIFLQTFPINNIVYIIFWPWRPVNILRPSFNKGCSTRKLIFPWNVFSLYF